MLILTVFGFLDNNNNKEKNNKEIAVKRGAQSDLNKELNNQERYVSLYTRIGN